MCKRPSPANADFDGEVQGKPHEHESRVVGSGRRPRRGRRHTPRKWTSSAIAAPQVESWMGDVQAMTRVRSPGTRVRRSRAPPTSRIHSRLAAISRPPARTTYSTSRQRPPRIRRPSLPDVLSSRTSRSTATHNTGRMPAAYTPPSVLVPPNPLEGAGPWPRAAQVGSRCAARKPASLSLVPAVDIAGYPPRDGGSTTPVGRLSTGRWTPGSTPLITRDTSTRPVRGSVSSTDSTQPLARTTRARTAVAALRAGTTHLIPHEDL